MNVYILSGVIAVTVFIGYLFGGNDRNPFVGAPTIGSTLSASSTAYVLTTTSQRLLATTSKRAAFTVQPLYCTLGAASTVFLNFNKDAPAVAATGYAVRASTTERFLDVDQNNSEYSVTGITDGGTCTTLVTEWRTNY